MPAARYYPVVVFDLDGTLLRRTTAPDAPSRGEPKGAWHL
jgi:hypothetical protein